MDSADVALWAGASLGVPWMLLWREGSGDGFAPLWVGVRSSMAVVAMSRAFGSDALRFKAMR